MSPTHIPQQTASSQQAIGHFFMIHSPLKELSKRRLRAKGNQFCKSHVKVLADFTSRTTILPAHFARIAQW